MLSLSVNKPIFQPVALLDNMPQARKNITLKHTPFVLSAIQKQQLAEYGISLNNFYQVIDMINIVLRKWQKKFKIELNISHEFGICLDIAIHNVNVQENRKISNQIHQAILENSAQDFSLQASKITTLCHIA